MEHLLPYLRAYYRLLTSNWDLGRRSVQGGDHVSRSIEILLKFTAHLDIPQYFLFPQIVQLIGV